MVVIMVWFLSGSGVGVDDSCLWSNQVGGGHLQLGDALCDVVKNGLFRVSASPHLVVQLSESVQIAEDGLRRVSNVEVGFGIDCVDGSTEENRSIESIKKPAVCRLRRKPLVVRNLMIRDSAEVSDFAGERGEDGAVIHCDLQSVRVE